jgi:hypothetical protein
MRDAEVRDLHRAIGGEQDVRRLDVAVNQPAGVRRLRACRGLGDDIQRPEGVAA